MKKNVVYLLGAGASIPFIRNSRNNLSTGQLTKEIQNWPKWKILLDRYDQYKNKASLGSLPPSIVMNDLILVIDRVIALLQKTSRFGTPNFEYIVHLLDGISDYFSAEHINEYERIDTLLSNFWFHDDYFIKRQFNHMESNIYGWRHVSFLAREIIATTIIDYWQQNDIASDALSMYRKYFSAIGSDYNSVSIHSFNYDPLLSTALQNGSNFETGFGSERLFYQSNFLKSRNIISFLHGHICFVPTSKEIYFEHNIQKAQNERMENLFGSSTQATAYFRMGGEWYKLQYIPNHWVG